MSKKKDDAFPAVINLRTGALQRLRPANQGLLKRRDMRETLAQYDADSSKLVEVDSSDTTIAVAESKDLARIGRQLTNLTAQREILLTSGLKLPGGEDYLSEIGVYDAKSDDIDVSALQANNAGLPRQEFTTPNVGIQDVTEELKAAESRKTASKKKAAAPSKKSDEVDTDF